MVAVQAVDNKAHQGAQFVNRLPHCGEGLALALLVVADRVHGVMVDVDNLLALNELTSIRLIHRQQVGSLHGQAVNPGQNRSPLLQ